MAQCDHPKPPVRMGLGLFCPDCEQRVGFVSQEEGEELITQALEQDLKNMMGE